MASEETEPEKMEVDPKQESPVKDAVRTLEAQLASSGASEEESSSATPIQVPGYETVTITQPSATDPGQVTQQQVIIHEGQAIEMAGEIHNVLLQEQPLQDQQEQVHIHIQEQPQIHVQEQPQILVQEQPQINVQEQPQIHVQEHAQIHVQDAEQPQILVQNMPEHVETVNVTQHTESGEAVPVTISSSNDSEQTASAVGTKPEEPKPIFKCVAVNANGAPDWSKVMNLNKDILKEVLEKHGISMDPSDWPMQTEEEHEAARKKKKKAKKAKKKKLKEKNRKSKGILSFKLIIYLEIAKREKKKKFMG